MNNLDDRANQCTGYVPGFVVLVPPRPLATEVDGSPVLNKYKETPGVYLPSVTLVSADLHIAMSVTGCISTYL